MNNNRTENNITTAKKDIVFDTIMDRTTLLLSGARFTSAIARLCLGPLLPILSLSLNFGSNNNPALLLSSYSSGYLFTQIAGGYLADRFGYRIIVSTLVFLSAFILFYISTFATTPEEWIRAYFCLGLVSGPLYPSGSAAIASNVAAHRRVSSFAIVDASASAGTTIASLAPLVADYMGWRFIYQVTGFGLLCVSFGIMSSSLQQQQQSDNNSDKTKTSSSPSLTSSSSKYPEKDVNEFENRISSTTATASIMFSPIVVCTYMCHCCDNFTKYSINSWAATMLVNHHGASPALVGSILATQEFVGVVSKLLVGTLFSFSIHTMSSSSLFIKRGTISAIGFIIQGVALWCAFQAVTPIQTGMFFILSAIATGSHSIGFRPIYLEASPKHAGAISGFGNSIASCASVAAPIIIGSSVYHQQSNIQGHHGENNTVSWSVVALYMIIVNICGALAALCISYSSRKGTTQQIYRKEESIYKKK